jgi:hypothetical protein
VVLFSQFSFPSVIHQRDSTADVRPSVAETLFLTTSVLPSQRTSSVVEYVPSPLGVVSLWFNLNAICLLEDVIVSSVAV